MEYRRDLLNNAMEQEQHCKDVNKILWWRQSWMAKKDVQDLHHLWFPAM